ncbi:MAG: hypothetical protein AAB342_02225 [Chloroflexota bacterium]
MAWQIDGTLYPDTTPPDTLAALADKVDFISRLCSAWDFGVLPDWDTLVEIRQETWRQAVDDCRLLTSPTYHLLRRWHRLASLRFLGAIPAYIHDDPNLAFV